MGRMVGADVMQFGGWQRFNAEYAKQFSRRAGPGGPARGGDLIVAPRDDDWWAGFWIFTALFCLEMSFTAYYELLRLPEAAQAFTRLGFPASYFRVELSWAKLAGVVRFSSPWSPRGSRSGPTPASPSTSAPRSSPPLGGRRAAGVGLGRRDGRPVGGLVPALARPARHDRRSRPILRGADACPSTRNRAREADLPAHSAAGPGPSGGRLSRARDAGERSEWLDPRRGSRHGGSGSGWGRPCGPTTGSCAPASPTRRWVKLTFQEGPALEGPRSALQLEPGGERQARHRHPRGRGDRRGGVEGPRPRGRDAEHLRASLAVIRIASRDSC